MAVPRAPLGALLLLVAVVLPSCGVSSTGPDPCAAAVPGAATRTVNANGARLQVTVAGPADAAPVVLLHGFPGTAATWRVVATDLAAVTTDLRLPPATVVGHDLGAMAAVAWARARPEQVARLVLSGGGVPGFGLAELGPPHLRTFGDAPPGAIEAAERPRLRTFLAGFTGTPVFPLDEAVAAYASPGRLDAAMGRYRALDRDAAANRADPRPLAMPVLVVAGGAPDLTVRTVTPLAPDRRVVVIPDAGHYVPIERPAAFADAVRG